MAALVICATSCTKEDVSSTVVGNGEVVEVNFSANLSELGTRVTTGSGAAADRLQVNVFDAANGNQLTELSRTDSRSSKDESFNFSLPLVKGMTYDIVLWADMGDNSIYTLKGKVVTADYSAVKSNDENLDAFCFVFKGFDPTNPAHSPHFTLRRPFAQLNAATNDKAAVAASGIELTTSEVKVLAYNQFDIFEGTVPQGATKAEVTFGAANIPGGDLNGNATYEYLSANYLFVPATGALTDAEYTFKGKKTNGDVVVTFTGTSYSAIPLKPNHRTNILGALLTKPADFVVDINADFTTPDEVVDIWDGKTVTEVTPVDDVYTITSANQLAWLAEQVNAGNTFKNKTVKLAANIDLDNKLWTPIGLGESDPKFQGTFDGAATRQGECHTISNLYIAPKKGEYTAAGLFGTLQGVVKNIIIDGAYVEHVTSSNSSGATTNGIAVVAGSTYNTAFETSIENVTVKNATVKGNRMVSAMIGYAQSAVKNCHIEDITLIATPDNLSNGYDNGDKVGGFIGVGTHNNAFVDGCSAKNVNITAYRDMGAIIGCGYGQKITNNSIEGVVNITIDQKNGFYGEKNANAEVILGRNEGEALATSNTVNAEVTICYLGTKSKTLSLSKPYNYVFEDLTIKVVDGDAVKIAENLNTTITLVGNVVLESEAGSGIDATNATLNLVGNTENHLTAKGNGTHAFGIGGDNAKVTLNGVTVDYVCGGYVQPLFEADTKYGKSEPEGGAAIGGAEVNILNSTITKADGGSKAAAIGARFWQSTTINIENSTIVEANGGNASAGIGGSRYAQDSKYNLEINIKNSTVTANGGQHGAGIGSGYDTHCNQQDYTATNQINIDATSTVNAKGGKYAAGIGTGFHSAYLTGAIETGATVNAVSGENFYKDAYTKAQNIGYGVVDPAREFSKDNYNVTFTVNGTVIENPLPPVVDINGTPYPSFKDAINAAQAGDTITLSDDVTLSEELEIPAGVTLNGNGKQINGSIYAGGDLTFEGHTKVTSFSAAYYNRTITIGEGACLEVTGGGRTSLAYGNTFDITGSITDAKTADKTSIQPSLILPAGISITGGNNATFNIKNAYVQIGSTTSKNSSANGEFTINIENSIAEFTNQLTFSVPTSGMNPTFNINVKNSVLTTAKKLILAAPNCNMVVDNSTINVATYFRNSGNVELKNGSVLTGSTIQFGESGGHDGVTTVDNSTFTINANNTGEAYDGKNSGSITAKNGANVNVKYYKDLTINADATSTFTGTEVF